MNFKLDNLPPGTKSLGTVLPPGIDVGGVNGATAVAGVPRSSKAKGKYRNVATYYKDIRYDSKGEAGRAEELDRLQAAGEILWWHPKPGTFHLGCKENSYRPDFLVAGLDRTWFEDFKGSETPKFKKDRKLWRAYGPCELRVVTSKGIEIIKPTHGDTR